MSLTFRCLFRFSRSLLRFLQRRLRRLQASSEQVPQASLGLVLLHDFRILPLDNSVIVRHVTLPWCFWLVVAASEEGGGDEDAADAAFLVFVAAFFAASFQVDAAGGEEVH